MASLIIEKTKQIIDEISRYTFPIYLVVATKYATVSEITELSTIDYPLIFGENRVNQGGIKQAALPDIKNQWHFIGHLQRNKVKKVIQSYSLIHSVDSLRLLFEINDQSKKLNQVTDVLLQVNPLNDQEKFGFLEQELIENFDKISVLSNVGVRGLMTMAPFTDNTTLIRRTFKKTRKIFNKLKTNGVQLDYLSMGMSNDYKIAIDEGGNMVRLGSIIFK